MLRTVWEGGIQRMKYTNIKRGVFISRLNRFIANVIIDGKMETVHVKNTGRCKELLIEGANVYLQHNDNASRKTKWSLIGVEKGKRLVNIDSQAPNKVVLEWLKEEEFFKNIKRIKPEFKYGESRIDFLVETDTEKALIEVKGVTLEEDDIAMFPDAPTERGVRHIFELCKSLGEGYKAYVLFVIQMEGIKHFTPNAKTHQAFADALSYAKEKGVQVLAKSCEVGEDWIRIKDDVKVVLKP
jgi:sugar fermentation stimulation protein A